MHIFSDLDKYRRRPTCSNVEEISLKKDDDTKNGKRSKIKERFQVGAGCLVFLALLCSPILLIVLPEEVWLCIGIIAFVFGILPRLLALLGLPFLIASGITKSKWKIFIVGIVIIALSVLAISLYDNLKGENTEEYFEYLDSNRPDKW